MHRTKTITPQEAALSKKTVEEQLHEAINRLLSMLYSGSPVFISEHDLRELFGYRWNLAEHSQWLSSVVHRYALAGWSIVEDASDPHRRRWLFSANC